MTGLTDSAELRLQWPFQNIRTSMHLPTGWVLLHGPVVTRAQHDQFALLRRRGYRFAGMSSYFTFPRPEPGDMLDYQAVCEVWCHCFREPESYLDGDLPRALISASDFTNYFTVSPEAIGRNKMEQSFDFMYVGATEGWKRPAKGWGVAAECIPRICRELGLRALVIGSPTADFAPSGSVAFAEALEWRNLLEKLCAVRFLFVPNTMDASPRLLTEALCLNVPVVVNREILGGWKYVNRFTGVFFTGSCDVVEAVQTCLDRSLSPREWFRANYGPYLAGSRLLQLLRCVAPDIITGSHLVLAE